MTDHLRANDEEPLGQQIAALARPRPDRLVPASESRYVVPRQPSYGAAYGIAALGRDEWDRLVARARRRRDLANLLRHFQLRLANLRPSIAHPEAEDSVPPEVWQGYLAVKRHCLAECKRLRTTLRLDTA